MNQSEANNQIGTGERMVLLALGGALIIGAAVALVNSGARGTGGPLGRVDGTSSTPRSQI